MRLLRCPILLQPTITGHAYKEHPRHNGVRIIRVSYSSQAGITQKRGLGKYMVKPLTTIVRAPLQTQNSYFRILLPWDEYPQIRFVSDPLRDLLQRYLQYDLLEVYLVPGQFPEPRMGQRKAGNSWVDKLQRTRASLNFLTPVPSIIQPQITGTTSLQQG